MRGTPWLSCLCPRGLCSHTNVGMTLIGPLHIPRVLSLSLALSDRVERILSSRCRTTRPVLHAAAGDFLVLDHLPLHDARPRVRHRFGCDFGQVPSIATVCRRDLRRRVCGLVCVKSEAARSSLVPSTSCRTRPSLRLDTASHRHRVHRGLLVGRR